MENLELVRTEGKAYNVKGASPAELARIARADWKKPYFGAVPYLEAMETLPDWKTPYMFDSGRSIGLYFLSNASTWRGDVAKAVKKEMKSQLGLK